jgi:hypothetical protein
MSEYVNFADLDEDDRYALRMAEMLQDDEDEDEYDEIFADQYYCV